MVPITGTLLLLIHPEEVCSLGGNLSSEAHTTGDGGAPTLLGRQMGPSGKSQPAHPVALGRWITCYKGTSRSYTLAWESGPQVFSDLGHMVRNPMLRVVVSTF